jgi:catechol 2,3-dioxygenase-like lactoylglutathione lyase family enzyme
MMNLKNCSTALFVEDIEVSKDFYCNILGFEIEFDFGKNVIFKTGVAIWEIDSHHIIPSTLGLDKVSNPAVNRFELYFETEDISGIYLILKEKQVRFLHEIQEEPWGQETIRFFDPDNHLIEVGESMEQFVRKLYSRGLSIEEIHNKTFIPENNINQLIKRQ